MADLSVIIVNWRSVGFLGPCLDSLAQGAGGLALEVHVVDNASNDGCGEMLAARYPAVRFTQSAVNLGFSGANNLAARSASGRRLLFLNPDTVVHGQAVRLLWDAMEADPLAGAAGGRLFNTDGSLQKSCVQAFPTLLNTLFDSDLLRRWFPRSRLWGIRALLEPGSEPREVDMVSGAGLMTPRDLFAQLGGFSEDYFMYYEDAGYCRRVHKAGRRVLHAPQARITHHGGGSTRQQDARIASVVYADSCRTYFRKNHGMVQAAMFRAGLGVVACIRLVLLGLGRAARPRSARLAASWTNWRSILRWSLTGKR